MKANKKNICKKVMACGLALSMMAPVTSFAAVQQSSEITGDNTVENGIFNVVLPTEVTFAVDPMELLNKAEDGPNSLSPGTESNQIASTNLNIINQSNYAIRVDAYTSLKLNSDIKLKDAETDVKEESTDKVMYLGIGSLTEAVPTKEPDSDVITLKTKYKIGKIKTPETTPAPGTDPEPQINQPVGKKPADTDSYKYDTKISCVLDKVVYSTDKDGNTTVADPASTNVGGFVFYGKVNSKAPWADGDITANVVFDIKGMSASEYELAKKGEKDPTDATGATYKIKPIIIENMANSVKPEKYIVPQLPTAAASVNDADKKTVSINFTNQANGKATRVVSAKVLDKDGVELGELPVGSFTSTYDSAGAGKIKFVAGEGTLDSATLEDTYKTLLVATNQIQVVFDDGMTMTPVIITAATTPSP